MALLLETDQFVPTAHRVRRQARHHGSRPALYLVPENGVLVFPGVSASVAPPAQLGPLMTPPGHSAMFGH